MKTWIKIVIELYLLMLIISGSYFIGALTGDNFQQKVIENTLKKDFMEKDLEFIDKKQTFSDKWYSDEDFETYNWYFQTQYNYDVNSWDCKASALNWAGYLNKHNVEYKYIYTENHIMVFAFNDNGFCLFSNNNTYCEGELFN